jgi:type VI secretion system FHA domain protein
MIRIKVVSNNSQPLPQSFHAEFDELGGNIGRADGNALILSDPGRSISRIHASVVYRGGQYFIRGLGSTMPVYLNEHPLNNGQDTAIADGDRLRIGDYVLQVIDTENAVGVSLSEGTALHFGTESEAPANNQSLADLLAFPTGDAKQNPPVATDEASNPIPFPGEVAAPPKQAIPFDFDPIAALSTAENKLPEITSSVTSHSSDVLNPVLESKEKQLDINDVINPVKSLMGFPGSADPKSMDPLIALNQREAGQAAQRNDTSELKASLPPLHVRTESASAQTPPVLEQKPSVGKSISDHEALLQAFLSGTGLSNLEKPIELTPQLMSQIGQLLRMSTQGTLDLLFARALMKREMRAESTMMAPRENNPLKLSPNVEVAMMHLLMPKSKEHGYMQPLQAMKDAYNDLRSHQFGFMAGMRASLSGVLDRFNPKRLEKRLEQKTLIDSVFSIKRKAELWDMFTERYSDISSEAEEDFQIMFSKEFLRAYEAQIAKLEMEDQKKH